MTAAPVNVDLLLEFERNLDPQRPERSKIPARILGYGEISTVFEIQAEEFRGLAFKRLPLFRDEAEVRQYCVVFEEYNRLLEQEIGLLLPAHSHAVVAPAAGAPVFYIVQEQLSSASIGHRALHTLDRESVLALVRRTLQELRKVWDYDRRQDRVQVAIDGQISNWSIQGLDPASPRVDQARLAYLDTSTPLFRVNGVEQLDTELFLRSAPSFLVWLLRRLFLRDVVDRYYDPHRVAVDLIANFFKEQRADFIPDVVSVVNRFFAGPAADLDIQPITEQEVRSYYREDALIWRLYLAMRKTDRFIRKRLLGRPYPYILPNKIRR